MHRLVLFVIFFCWSSLLANEDKILRIRTVTQPISVDGVMEPAWLDADSASDFVQQQPFHGRDPSRRTVVRVLTTEDALYCLIVAYDAKENIQRNTGKLDDFAGDIVSIMLDTFGDKKTAYKFAVSASGVKADSRMLDDARNRDYGWDGVWFSDAAIYDWGYVVEIEIPYRSIQYEKNLASWGLDFDRWIPGLNEDLYWCRYEENEGQRISKFGTLVFEQFRPSVKGSNFELYPVALGKASYLGGSSYKVESDVGVDLFYNPSPQLTFQLTGNPDFAQIEADPFTFNISRYETYYNERRLFFTQGNEVFLASGRQRNSGFYRPLELFYSRRIGKKLPDGTEVPLLLGTKAFGRIGDWEYGGFLAMTGRTEYGSNSTRSVEDRATFASARIKKQILGNSTAGLLFVGKHTSGGDEGVVDIDGAFRTSDWQLSYQLARSFKNRDGDFGGSAGFVMFTDRWAAFARTRIIGSRFDVNQVGFVPWRGTAELTALTGPRWYYQEGYISQILLYAGGVLYHEKADGYTDHLAAAGFNMQFRTNWGYEVNVSFGKSKDLDQRFNSYEVSLSSWFQPSPDWNGNVWGGYSRTYNFRRTYLAYYAWLGSAFNVQAFKTLQVGTSTDAFVEYKPDRSVEEIVLNARPYCSLTPVNDLNIRVYLDGVYFHSTQHIHQTILGVLFSYNFLPKSWIYFALNEVRDRSSGLAAGTAALPNRLRVVDRAGVLKIKYLYYF